MRSVSLPAVSSWRQRKKTNEGHTIAWKETLNQKSSWQHFRFWHVSSVASLVKKVFLQERTRIKSKNKTAFCNDLISFDHIFMEELDICKETLFDILVSVFTIVRKIIRVCFFDLFGKTANRIKGGSMWNEKHSSQETRELRVSWVYNLSIMAKSKKKGELDIPTHIMSDLCRYGWK